MISKWYAWVIKSGKFEIVKAFLEENVPEVVDVYYPFIQKERSVFGKIVVKDVPLFSGYIFFKYESSLETYYKLNGFLYITTYIGQCDVADIDRIRGIKTREENKEFVSKREFDVEDEVLIVNGQFVNFKGVIKDIQKDAYFVEVPIFNRHVIFKCNVNDIVSEEGDLFEW